MFTSVQAELVLTPIPNNSKTQTIPNSASCSSGNVSLLQPRPAGCQQLSEEQGREKSPPVCFSCLTHHKRVFVPFLSAPDKCSSPLKCFGTSVHLPWCFALKFFFNWGAVDTAGGVEQNIPVLEGHWGRTAGQGGVALIFSAF